MWPFFLWCVDPHGGHPSRRTMTNGLVSEGSRVLENLSLDRQRALHGAHYPPDNASSTYEERNALAARLNHAMAGMMGSGWCWHVDAIRRPASGYPPPEQSRFPDRVTEAIDQERRQFFEALGNLYETESILTVTYQPPAKVVRRLGEWMYDDDRPKADAQQEAEGVLGRFCRDVDALEDRLSSVFRLERLKARTEVEEDGEPVVYDEL